MAMTEKEAVDFIHNFNSNTQRNSKLLPIDTRSKLHEAMGTLGMSKRIGPNVTNKEARVWVNRQRKDSNAFRVARSKHIPEYGSPGKTKASKLKSFAEQGSSDSERIKHLRESHKQRALYKEAKKSGDLKAAAEHKKKFLEAKKKHDKIVGNDKKEYAAHYGGGKRPGPVLAKKKKPKVEMKFREKEKPANAKTLSKGPKGGMYYMSGGKKVYVGKKKTPKK